MEKNLILHNNMDALDTVNKWYYETVSGIDHHTEKVKLNNV